MNSLFLHLWKSLYFIFIFSDFFPFSNLQILLYCHHTVISTNKHRLCFVLPAYFSPLGTAHSLYLISANRWISSRHCWEVLICVFAGPDILHYFLSVNSTLLYGCTTVCSSPHLLKKKYLGYSYEKSSIDIHMQVFVWT